MRRSFYPACLVFCVALSASGADAGPVKTRAVSTDTSQPFQQIPSLPGVNVYAVYNGPGDGADPDEILLGSTLLFCTQDISGVCLTSAKDDFVPLGTTGPDGFLAGDPDKVPYNDFSGLTGIPPNEFGTIELSFLNTATSKGFNTSDGIVTPFSGYGDGILFMDFIDPTQLSQFPINFPTFTSLGDFNGETIVDQLDIQFRETVIDPGTVADPTANYYNDAFISLIYTQPAGTSTTVPEPQTLLMFGGGLIAMLAMARRRRMTVHR
jgi:PEP-CTERM motif